jgi:hypothetical protein
MFPVSASLSPALLGVKTDDTETQRSALTQAGDSLSVTRPQFYSPAPIFSSQDVERFKGSYLRTVGPVSRELRVDVNLIARRVDNSPPIPFAVMPIAAGRSPHPGCILHAGPVKDVHPATRKSIVREMESPLPRREVLSIPGAHVIVEQLHSLSFKLRIDSIRSVLSERHSPAR